MKVLIEKIYHVLTNRKVRRAWPSNPRVVKDCIKYFLKLRSPLILTTTWLGVKTTKKGVADNADRVALLFLKKNIVEKLEQIKVKVIIKIMFADSSASYLLKMFFYVTINIRFILFISGDEKNESRFMRSSSL